MEKLWYRETKSDIFPWSYKIWWTVVRRWRSSKISCGSTPICDSREDGMQVKEWITDVTAGTWPRPTKAPRSRPGRDTIVSCWVREAFQNGLLLGCILCTTSHSMSSFICAPIMDIYRRHHHNSMYYNTIIFVVLLFSVLCKGSAKWAHHCLRLTTGCRTKFNRVIGVIWSSVYMAGWKK